MKRRGFLQGLLAAPFAVGAVKEAIASPTSPAPHTAMVVECDENDNVLDVKKVPWDKIASEPDIFWQAVEQEESVTPPITLKVNGQPYRFTDSQEKQLYAELMSLYKQTKA